MGLMADVGGGAEGYEEVTLPFFHDEPQGTQGLNAAVLRRRSARPTKRAVIYLHCMRDAFVPADLAGWYTDRGFHFYVADLRTLAGPGGPGGPGRPGQEGLGEIGRHTSELQSHHDLVCRLLLEKKKKTTQQQQQYKKQKPQHTIKKYSNK